MSQWPLARVKAWMSSAARGGGVLLYHPLGGVCDERRRAGMERARCPHTTTLPQGPAGNAPRPPAFRERRPAPRGPLGASPVWGTLQEQL
eukprot:scaffold7923_cov121-Isochrysis_galbana.AAC.12